MIRSTRMIVAGLGVLFCAAYGHLPSAHAASGEQRICRPWNHGAAARRHGWQLTQLQGAQRWAVLSFYDESVAPRADPKATRS